jgi:putative spermidine/putrescine transport system permease protein
VTRAVPALYQAALWLVALAVVAFLLFPLIVVVPESFSSTTILYFPPHGYSTRWYHDFIHSTNPDWISSVWLSVRLASAVAVLATVIGIPAAVALHRYVRRGRGAIRMIVLSPVIVPVIVSAIALFDIASKLQLIGSFRGLLLAHTVLALPFPIIIIESALGSVDPVLEEAAISLGASRFQAFSKVTLRLILPSVLGAALFAFITSWDEVVVVLFVGGAFLQTLPVTMFQFITTQVTPTVAAVSTILVAAVLVVLTVIQIGPLRRFRNLQRRRLAASAAPASVVDRPLA